MWDTSCPDWEERLLSGTSLVPDLPLFETEVDRATRMFNRLKLPDLYGQPTRGQVCGPYIYPIVAAIFGSLNPETYERFIKEFFLMIPKGNDKTGSAATIALLWTLMNKKPEAELVLIAPSKNIADRGFEYAAGIIRADSALEEAFHPPSSHTRRIERRLIGSSISVVAADTSAATGGKQTVTVIDETHELSLNSKASAIMIELRGAYAKSSDGFMIQITTQSKTPPSGMFAAELEKARAVRDGKLQLPILPILYELPKRMQKDGGWKDRKLWPLVNPMWGLSVKPANLENQFVSAQSEGDTAMALFASQHLNVQIGIGQGIDGWAGALYWPKAVHPELSREAILAANPGTESADISWLQLAALIERCEVLTLGIDGGGLDDLLGITVIGREKGKEKDKANWFWWSHAVAAPIAIDRHKANIPHYNDFERDGDLTVADLPADMVVLDRILGTLEESGKLATVSVDPSCVDDIKEACALHDINEENGRFVGERQGIGLMKAIKTTERKLAAKRMFHCGQPLMTWCTGNAKVRLTSAAMLIERSVSGKDKIDPLVAGFNAVMGMTANPETAGTVEIFAL
jgi:phage terminase large subunit-like protein